jgi:hypothetical protein
MSDIPNTSTYNTGDIPGEKAAAAAAETSAWLVADLSTFAKTDANSIEGAATSLGTTSTVDFNNVHGSIDSSMDALFYTGVLADFDRTKHWGVAIRATWSNTTAGNWQMYLGSGNDAVPAADKGCYFAAQLDSSAFVGANDYGAAPANGESVTGGRYLGGVVIFKSDRQGGSVSQIATSDRTSRGGITRTTTPANAMTTDAQYVMVGFGNASAAGAEALTGLQVEYQLLAHHGQDA